MLKHLTIRFISSADFAQWLPLWDGYNSFYGRSGPTALPQEITEKTWGRFLDTHEPMYALVAEENKRLIALAHFLFHRSTTLMNPICYLQDLFTLKEVRGQGVGRALIEAVCEQAKIKGSKRVYWQTHESNVDAMKLYDQLA